MSVVHFFRVVRVQPVTVRIAVYAAGCLGVWGVVLDPARPASAAMTLLYVQMFACSTGFTRPACAGHFDPVLTLSRRQRRGVVVRHWWVSARDGLMMWLVVGAAAGAAGGDTQATLGLSGVAALVFVSIVSWSAGIALPRGGAGVGWTVAMVAVIAVPGMPEQLRVSSLSADGSLQAFASTVALAAVFPFTLVERTGAHALAWQVPAMLLLVGAATFAAALAYLARRSYPIAS